MSKPRPLGWKPSALPLSYTRIEGRKRAEAGRRTLLPLPLRHWPPWDTPRTTGIMQAHGRLSIIDRAGETRA